MGKPPRSVVMPLTCQPPRTCDSQRLRIQPVLPGSPWQLVAIAQREDLGDIDGGQAFLARQIVSIERDGRAAVLRECAGARAAFFEVLLHGVIHQEAEARRISLLHAQVEGVVVDFAVEKVGITVPLTIG